MSTATSLQSTATSLQSEEEDLRITTAQRVGSLAVVILPFLGLITAMILLWGRGLGWVDLGLLASMYVATAMGVTIGFHRLFTHRAFETSRPIRCVLSILGSMSAQGPVLHWVSIHRRHHQHSDAEHDPHSPHLHGSGFWGVLCGFWHAHVGWLMGTNPEAWRRYTEDLRRSRLLRVVHALFPLWVTLGLLIPAGLGGWITGSWMGALTGFIWGGLVRLFLLHHVTWSVNSICHLWGTRPYNNGDHSRNNLVIGILAMGEGWHNNHHAFPRSARHGLHWWQPDLSYMVIRAMALVRLASKVQVPSPEAMQARKRLEPDGSG